MSGCAACWIVAADLRDPFCGFRRYDRGAGLRTSRPVAQPGLLTQAERAFFRTRIWSAAPNLRTTFIDACTTHGIICPQAQVSHTVIRAHQGDQMAR